MIASGRFHENDNENHLTSISLAVLKHITLSEVWLQEAEVNGRNFFLLYLHLND